MELLATEKSNIAEEREAVEELTLYVMNDSAP